MMNRALLRIRARRLRPTAALIALSASLLASPVAALSVDVRWDNVSAPYAGYGVSQATALGAQAAGIPLLSVQAVRVNDQVTPGAEHVATPHDLDASSVVIPTPIGSVPATATSNWAGTNNTMLNGGGGPLEQLYLVFARPDTNQILLNGQLQDITYDPIDVGLTLQVGEGGADWVILQVPSIPFDLTSDPVYYPAVSLGALGIGESAPFQLHYTLANPQVFLEPYNSELGIPRWNLYYTSSSLMVPEPSTALLLAAGLGSFAAVRRRAR